MPAPKRSNTVPAHRARSRKARERRLETMAETLRVAGYLVTAPDSIAHQDSAGMSGSPLGIFADGELVETVSTSDRHGEAACQRVADRLGRPVEVLITCPQHPTSSAVDCLICIPEDRA